MTRYTTYVLTPEAEAALKRLNAEREVIAHALENDQMDDQDRAELEMHLLGHRASIRAVLARRHAYNNAQNDLVAQDDDVPPKLAEFLLTGLATSRAAEAMIGDLNERFADECKKLGRDRAARLYWARTLRSLWPLLKRAIGKALKWGAVIDTVRRHL